MLRPALTSSWVGGAAFVVATRSGGGAGARAGVEAGAEAGAEAAPIARVWLLVSVAVPLRVVGAAGAFADG
jgi:hypothetical protein